MRTLKRILSWDGVTLMALVGVVVLAWVSRERETLERRVDERLEAKRIELAASQARLLAALDLLKRNPLFAPAGTKKDAGPYLNPLMAWSRNPGASPAPLALSLVLRKTSLGAALQDWSGETVKKTDLAGVNFGWMKRLSEFDHWEAGTHGWSLLPEANRLTFDGLSPPEPEVALLGTWLRLRLIHGLQTGTERDAFLESFQLARLGLSTELPGLKVLGALALRILGSYYERVTVLKPEVATSLSKWVPPAWRADPKAWREDVKAVTPLILYIAQFVGPSPLDLSSAVGERVPPLLCMGLWESLSVDTIYRAVATTPKMTAKRAAIEAEWSTFSRCRLRLIHAQWNDAQLHGAIQEAGLRRAASILGAKSTDWLPPFFKGELIRLKILDLALSVGPKVDFDGAVARAQQSLAP